jgi:hypothetical protein
METKTTQILKEAITLSNKNAELKGKQEILDKITPAINNYLSLSNKYDDILESLIEHNQLQEESILQATATYNESLLKRKQKAKKFIEGKTSEELMVYLADQPVAYNDWKNADHGKLVKLVLKIYD